MMWDLGDDVNFLLACTERELDDNIAYKKATKEGESRKIGKFTVKKAESFNEDFWVHGSTDMDDEKSSCKHEVKERASFSSAN